MAAPAKHMVKVDNVKPLVAAARAVTTLYGQTPARTVGEISMQQAALFAAIQQLHEALDAPSFAEMET